jgi:hypothetical protein
MRWAASGLLAIGACVLGGGILGGCASGGSSVSSTTTSSLLTVPLPTLPGTKTEPDGRQYLIVGGKKVLLPSEQGTRGISPQQDLGQQVMITPEGMWPNQLLAQIQTITFTNVTDRPERITFEHSTIRSPVIAAAGGTWSWTPKGLISYGYHDSSGQMGGLIVGAIQP